MDITLIAITSFLLGAILLLLIFLFKSINKKTFKADDGSTFDNKYDLELYIRLYEKTKPLFLIDKDLSSTTPLLGFENSFLIKLKNGGFSDLKTVIKYRKQFNLLRDLINT